MFNPSRDQVRQFFIDTWQKHKNQQILSPLEAIALDWIEQHPEYHSALEQPDSMTREFNVFTPLDAPSHRRTIVN
jgi:hypothetical protein